MMLAGEEEKERNIVYICDENYLLPTIVSIQSLAENTCPYEGFHYTVHVCALSVNRENQEKLSRLENKNVKICIHNIDRQKYLEAYHDIQQKTYVTLTALIKFDLPEILSGIDEVLYLDSDIIVNQPLGSIFNYDLSDYALAASFDIVWYRAISNYAHPLSKPTEFYFNAGVMLLNLKEFRRNHYTELLRETKLRISDSENPLNLMDQNALNQVLLKRCLPVPIRFNCPNQYLASLNIDIRDINRLYGTKYQDTAELFNDTVLIHYIGRRNKPWKYQDCRGREIWDFYCDKAGIDRKTLNRVSETDHKRKNLRYYAGKTWHLLKARGLKGTIRYLLCWIKLKGKGAGPGKNVPLKYDR